MNIIGYIGIYVRANTVDEIKLNEKSKEIIKRVKDDWYSINEWNEAISFLCGKRAKQFESIADAKNFLLSYEPLL